MKVRIWEKELDDENWINESISKHVKSIKSKLTDSSWYSNIFFVAFNLIWNLKVEYLGEELTKNKLSMVNHFNIVYSWHFVIGFLKQKLWSTNRHGGYIINVKGILLNELFIY